MSIQLRAKDAKQGAIISPPSRTYPWTKAPPMQYISIMNDDDRSILSELSNGTAHFRAAPLAHAVASTPSAVAHHENNMAFGKAASSKPGNKENKPQSHVLVQPIYMHGPHEPKPNSLFLMPVPAVLGRKNLVTTWWKHCPYHCHAHEKAATKETASWYGFCLYCQELFKELNHQKLSRKMMYIIQDEARGCLRLYVTTKFQSLIHWTKSSPSSLPEDYNDFTLRHGEVGLLIIKNDDKNTREWMRFEIRGVADDDNKDNNSTHGSSTKQHDQVDKSNHKKRNHCSHSSMTEKHVANKKTVSNNKTATTTTTTTASTPTMKNGTVPKVITVTKKTTSFS
jgi:hypothetical protein